MLVVNMVCTDVMLHSRCVCFHFFLLPSPHFLTPQGSSSKSPTVHIIPSRVLCDFASIEALIFLYGRYRLISLFVCFIFSMLCWTVVIEMSAKNLWYVVATTHLLLKLINIRGIHYFSLHFIKNLRSKTFGIGKFIANNVYFNLKVT
jgi:hypothetical protein